MSSGKEDRRSSPADTKPTCRQEAKPTQTSTRVQDSSSRPRSSDSHRVNTSAYFLAAQVAQGIESEVGRDSQLGRDFALLVAAIGRDLVDAVENRHCIMSYGDRARAQGRPARTVGGSLMLSVGVLLTGFESIGKTCPNEAAAGRKAVEEMMNACGGTYMEKKVEAWMAEHGSQLRESWNLAVAVAAAGIDPHKTGTSKRRCIDGSFAMRTRSSGTSRPRPE